MQEQWTGGVTYLLGRFLTVQNPLISEKKKLKLQRLQITTEPWYATKKTTAGIRKLLVVKLRSRVLARGASD